MLLFLSLLISIVLCFIVVYLYFQYCYLYWKRKGAPYLTPSFPLGNNVCIGANAFSFGLETYHWYNAFKKMNVPFGGVWSFCNQAIVIMDTSLIKDILTKDFNTFINREFNHNATDPRTEDLFVLKGEQWRFSRQKLTPAFTSAKMRYMFHLVSDSSRLLLDSFGNAADSGKEINLRLAFDKYTMDNIGAVAFGLDFNCQISEDDKFRQIADVLVSPNITEKVKRVLSRLSPGLSLKLGINIVNSSVIEFFSDLITTNVENRKKNNIRKNDFTQLMIDLMEDESRNRGKFDMNDVIANCLIFFLAGFDTSSKTMQLTLLELGRNEELQNKTRNEIVDVLNKYNGEITYEGFQEMTYLRQVVDETLRLYPPVLAITRICQQDYKINNSNFILEKGITAVIPVLGLHRDPDLFPDPEKYDPDRFSPENKAKIISYSYLPFGEGPRICIGKRFGQMQTAVGLIRILSSFKVKISPKAIYPIRIKQGEFLLETDDVLATVVRT